VRKLFIAIALASALIGFASETTLAAPPLSKAERRKLILRGSKLWSVYCNECHNARPPGEKAPHEWDQEIMHMRMLGNIPAENARALVEYLKSR
jgi:hypothetical protein